MFSQPQHETADQEHPKTYSRSPKRDVGFAVVDGYLEMTVSFPHRPEGGYVHRCRCEHFKQVAHATEERADLGVTLVELVEACDLPFTQVNVALNFMKERGCVITRRRRSYPATEILFEDAMIELSYLEECGDVE